MKQTRYIFIHNSDMMYVKDQLAAVEMGQQLINRHFGHEVKHHEVFKDDDTYYRLIEDDETTALNSGDVSSCEPGPGWLAFTEELDDKDFLIIWNRVVRMGLLSF